MTCCKTLIRTVKWADVLDSMSDAMAESVETLNLSDKLHFILTGFHGAKYQDEWEYMYGAVLDFVYMMYKTKQKLMQDLL